MLRIFTNILSLILILLLSTFLYLSFVGFQTNKFNKEIESYINKFTNQLNVKIESIFLKFDLNKQALLLETKSPSIQIDNQIIDINKIALNINPLSIMSDDLEIKDINVLSNDLEIKNLLQIIKNYSDINNNFFLKGLSEKGTVVANVNFEIANKKIKNLNGILIGNKLSYVDKQSGVIDKINFEINFNEKEIKVSNLDFNISSIPIILSNISIKPQNGELLNILDISSNKELKFDGEGEIKISSIDKNKIIPVLSQFNLKGDFISELQGSLDINFDYNFIVLQDLKVSNFNSNINIIVKDLVGNLRNNYQIKKINLDIKKIKIKESKIFANISNGKLKKLSFEGLYSLNNDGKFKKLQFDNAYEKIIKSNFFLEADFNLKLDAINYHDPNNLIKLKGNLSFNKKDLYFDQLVFEQDKSLLKISKLQISKNVVQDFENISLLTVIEDNITNQFEITKSKTGILIDGDAYDATKLIQTIIDSDNQKFFYFDTKLEIRLKNLIKSNNNLRDFIMIGQLKGGNLVNLSSKVEDDIGSFLDINYNNKDNESTLKIFSTNPLLLLEEFSFFEGIRNGELEFEYLTSETSKTGSLKIKSFNLKEAPIFAKILSLADLRGLFDALSNEGIFFEQLEILFSVKGDELKIDEVFINGPSLSLLMDGYIDQESKLVSLSGDLIPAKMINSVISKIPVIGGVLVGDQKKGEGVFGVSFKIKGLPGDIKTTVNPIKTITPRFITRHLEGKK